MNFCRDCKHYGEWAGVCRHLSVRRMNFVTGRKEAVNVWKVRGFEEECGLWEDGGGWWERLKKFVMVLMEGE